MLNIQAEVSYIEIITNIHHFTHAVFDAMLKATWVLEKVFWKINNVVQGEFSITLWNPSYLVSTMEEIHKALPSDMVLSFLSPTYDVLKYCKHLKPLVILDNDKQHIVITLQVLHRNSKFNVVQAISVSVPAHNLSLSAIHTLELEFLTISPNWEWHLLIKSDMISQCSNYLGCKFNGPLFSVKEYPSCVTSLYLYKEKDILR